MEEKLNPVSKEKSKPFREEKQKQQWKEIECLLNLVYQEIIEHLTEIPWYKLSTDQIIDVLLRYNINFDFIAKFYWNELNRIAKKREEIEIFVYSKPRF